MNKLSEKESARLKELIQLKKSQKLTDSEKAELEKLNAKCGYRSGKKGPKHRGGKGLGVKRNFGNDISWWNKVPVLFNNAVNYAFNFVPGTDLGKPGFEQLTNDTDPFIRVAGAARVPMVPTFGVLGQASDPFNTVVRAIWLAERKKYRGLNSYEQADVGMAIIAILNAFGMIMRLERIYGILSQYKIGNRNIPYTLLRSLGISNVLADDLLLHIADFRSAINYFIVKLQPLCLPKGMSYLSDMDALLSNVYSDSKDHRAQSIVFDWDYMWVYTPYNSKKGGVCKLTNCTFNTQTSLDGLIAGVNTLIGDLLADEDITLICSDLYACFEEGNVEGMVAMPEDYKVVIEYSEEILHKWHNCTECPLELLKNMEMTDSVHQAFVADFGGYSMLTTTYIYQEDNVITARLGFNVNNGVESQPLGTGDWLINFIAQDSTGKVLYGDQLVDTWSENPDDVVRCEGVMFKTITIPTTHPASGGSTVYSSRITSCGCEILGYAIYYTRGADGAIATDSISVPYNADGYYTIVDLSAITKFDWHPILFGVMNFANAPGIVSYTYQSPIGDLNNVTLVTQRTVYRIHEAALMSAFNIGVIANTLQE